MEDRTINILTQPLTVHFKPGPGGKKFRYVEGRDVISRLNSAFGHEWSSKVLTTEVVDNQVIVLIELSHGDVVHQGYGGSEIALYKHGEKQGKPVDISNSYKAAFTNALKKAAEQFGVGLVSEDDVATPPPAAPSKPTVTTTPNPVTQGSVTMKAAPPQNNETATNNVSQASLEEQVREMLAKSTQVNPATATASAAPAKAQPSGQSVTLASSFKKGYDPESSRVPETSTPFVPSGDGDEMINDIQLHAIEGLARMKKLEATELITKAVPGTTKTEYKMLTKDEAKAVILTLNNTEATK